MKINQKKTLLSVGNISFKEGDYEKAIKHYEEAISQNQKLEKVLFKNIELAQKRLKKNTNHKTNTEKELEIPTIEFDNIKEEFIPYQKHEPFDPAVRLIAFYLPQFHPFPENDEWWGKGFTEWTNVGKATPNYEGHYQPHCPIHFGYYDLRIAEIQEEQAALAKEYGIYGFNYYFYWFDGKTLMESPLKAMLANRKVDIPFCLTWANENWSRRWDGQENDLLIAQNHSNDDSLAFIRHLTPYFNDERYIKIDGRPVLIIYRPDIIPNIKETGEIWRKELKSQGFKGLYLISAQTFGIKSPEPFGFDASLEFPPHTVCSTDIQHELKVKNKKFSGHIFSYDQVVSNETKKNKTEYKLYKTAMLSWDNTARKQDASHSFHGFSLLRYKQWLSLICSSVMKTPKHSPEEKLVFVNAWNEWAEGTHLEPDRKYGYGYLEATRQVLRQYDKKFISRIENQIIEQRSEVAVILHLHYIELWSEIKEYLSNFDNTPFDLYITTTNAEIIPTIKSDYNQAIVELVENRGRDILPFIETLRKIHNLNYTAICKIHSKKSTYRNDGSIIRHENLEALIGANRKIKEIISMFKGDHTIGMVVPQKYLIKHTDHNMTFDKEIVKELSEKIGIDFQYGHFPAGSMFWFRQTALSRLLLIDQTEFDVERGLADGTNAHGIERLFCIASEGIGYQTKAI